MSEPRARRLTVVEIEHDEDLRYAIDEIAKKGGTDVKVVEYNFDTEDAVISFMATDKAMNKIMEEADICL